MNANVTASTVTAAASAETRLVNSIHTAADALDRVGNGPVTEALERLAASAQAARTRLQLAGCSAAAILMSVTGEFDDLFPEDTPTVAYEGNSVVPYLPEPAPVAVPEEEGTPVSVAANPPVEPAPESPLTPIPETTEPTEQPKKTPRKRK